MSEASVIHCKVTGIRPFFDSFGNEFVCVEFGIEAERPPTVMSTPTSTPPEMSFIMPIISQIPKMIPQGKIYTSRLVLFLTTREWENVVKKYQYGDEVEIKIDKDGTLRVNPL